MNIDKIQEYMKEIFQTYKIAKKTRNHNKFWDVVVVTTYNNDQKICCEKQIEEFMGENHLIKGKLFVVADPPNMKLGCGGSTLHVLKTLMDVFGESVYEKKILIIHSGGCSQRLPSYSVQGKIFSPVPVKEFLDSSRVSHMIDLKLAMYLPFSQFLRPGIFVTCGDDIETFYMDPNKVDYEALQKADVVALAHPCDLETATAHGVYVLPNNSVTAKDSVVVSDCLEVLQKPSIALMREKYAIYINKKTNNEMVYSDSAFWMSERVCRLLLSWYLTSPVVSELDAYGHFLPCFGINTKNCNPEQFTDYKAELLPFLRNFDLKLIVLNESKFYHLGTMEEYLTNFTDNPHFEKELNIVKNTSNAFIPCCTQNGHHEGRSVIMACYFLKNIQIKVGDQSRLVVEWCSIETPIYVHRNLILSNCVLKKCTGVQFLQNVISFFGNFIYHTIPLQFRGRLLYVTFAFETNTDLKKCYNDSHSISIASVPFNKVLQLGLIKESEVYAVREPFSLWDLKLFRGASTAEESFWKTHNFINKILHWKNGIPMQSNLTVDETEPIFSMKDAMKFKDFDTFLRDRKKLIQLINSCPSTENS